MLPHVRAGIAAESQRLARAVNAPLLAILSRPENSR